MRACAGHPPERPCCRTIGPVHTADETELFIGGVVGTPCQGRPEGLGDSVGMQDGVRPLMKRRHPRRDRVYERQSVKLFDDHGVRLVKRVLPPIPIGITENLVKKRRHPWINGQLRKSRV